MALLDAYLLRSAQKVFAIKVLVGSVDRGPSFKGVYLYIYTVTKDYVMCDISNLNQSQVEVLILIDFILKVIRIEGFGQKMGGSFGIGRHKRAKQPFLFMCAEELQSSFDVAFSKQSKHNAAY